MSIHEIEIEGLGPEWEAVGVNAGQHVLDHDGSDVKYVGAVLKIRRKVRKYDHSKTLDDVLVMRKGASGCYPHSNILKDSIRCIVPAWQPNIHGKCPVDGEACWVRVRTAGGTEKEAKASDIDWGSYGFQKDVVAWQFIRLADGYEW